MGGGLWDKESYRGYVATSSTKSRAEVFSRSSVKDSLNPAKITFRECRDSEGSPEATPVIIGLDVTGSMGHIPETLAKGELGKLMDQLLERRPLRDPQLAFMGIGDCVARDYAPLQVTQFESDNAIVEQLTDIWLEGHGGGNRYESYDLAWAFAANKVLSDAWESRQKKGYIFTIGDELYPRSTNPDFIKTNIGGELTQPTPELFQAAAEERYEVFHIIIEEGNGVRSQGRDKTIQDWSERLGYRALPLSNYHYLVELIVTAIAISEGADVEATLASWGNTTISDVLRAALRLDGQQSSAI